MSLSKISTNFTQSGNTSSVTSVPLSGLVDQMKHKQPNGLYQTDNEFEQWQNDYNKWKEIAETSKNSQESTSVNENKKHQKYNDYKYIERRDKHDKKKKRKKNNLRKPPIESKENNLSTPPIESKKNNPRRLADLFKVIDMVAQPKFEEYVKRLNLSDLIKKAQKAGLEVSWGICNNRQWAYYGLVKKIPLGEGGEGPWTPEAHGIGVAVDMEYLNVIDDQLLMFDQDHLMDKDKLDISNLGGLVIHGDDIPKCNEAGYNNNIKCIDPDSSQTDIFKAVNDTFIDTNNNEKLDAYVIGLNTHGSSNGYIYDLKDLISKTKKIFDTQQKAGIKINKPFLIIKTACFNARKAWNKYGTGDETDEYDELCKTASNCTNQYTVCAYHNNDDETAWGTNGLKDIFASSYDYAFDLYKDGKLIQKNITAEKMNEYMNNTLNNGTWDIPDSREKYIRFVEQLVPAIKNQTIDAEQSTSTFIEQSSEQLKEQPSTSNIIEQSTEQQRESEQSTEHLIETEPSTSTFIEQTEQPKEQEPSTEQQQKNNDIGSYVGLGAVCTVVTAAAGVAGCRNRRKCCFKEQELNSQDQNKQNINNVEIYQNKETDRENIVTNKERENIGTNKDFTQQRISSLQVKDNTKRDTTKKIATTKKRAEENNKKRATTPNGDRRNIRRQNVKNLTHINSDVKTFNLNN